MHLAIIPFLGAVAKKSWDRVGASTRTFTAMVFMGWELEVAWVSTLGQQMGDTGATRQGLHAVLRSQGPSVLMGRESQTSDGESKIKIYDTRPRVWITNERHKTVIPVFQD